jgi:hypothetical protein
MSGGCSGMPILLLNLDFSQTIAYAYRNNLRFKPGRYRSDSLQFVLSKKDFFRRKRSQIALPERIETFAPPDVQNAPAILAKLFLNWDRIYGNIYNNKIK